MKILNLYAGIGGNRELWGNEHMITAVECDDAIASAYYKRFSHDVVFHEDAESHLEKYYSDYDFIWASPPCPSHSQYRHNVGVLGKGFAPILPDMSLYSIIVFLRTYHKGKWAVENVIPYYTPLIEPTIKLQRHLIWCNFPIAIKSFGAKHIRTKNKISDYEEHEVVCNSRIKNKRQVLRNCVAPELGLYIYDCARIALATGE